MGGRAARGHAAGADAPIGADAAFVRAGRPGERVVPMLQQGEVWRQMELCLPFLHLAGMAKWGGAGRERGRLVFSCA